MAETISPVVTNADLFDYVHNRPSITRSLTCPGALSRNMNENVDLAAGLHRRCRSEGGGRLSHHRPPFFGGTASSFSDPESDDKRIMIDPSINPAAKSVRFSAEAEVVPSKRTNATTRSACAWGITSDMLSAVPPNYPILMPSATFSGQTAEIVGARISEFFRRNSIHAQYHHAKAEVRATMSDGIEFVVALWKADDEGGIIIEAQRLYGPSPAFHHIIHDLFRVVRDGDFITRQTAEEEAGTYATGTRIISDPPRTTEEDLLFLVSEMIRCDIIETRELGLQSLQFLVASKKAGSKRALEVANAIVHGRAEQGSDIRNDLFAIIIGGSVDEDGNGGIIGGGIEERDDRLRSIALQILVDVLETIGGDKASSLAYQKKAKRQFWERLIPALVTDIENASYRPHDAVRAIEAIRGFVELSSHGRDTALRCGLEPVLNDAREYGHSQYQSLESKSANLMSALLT